jgi:hypothetical protein
MNFITIFLQDSILNKKNLRKTIEDLYSDKKLIRFFISYLESDSICVEILILQ